MINALDLSSITEKTEELCLTILEQPSFKELRQMIQTFITDDAAVGMYNTLVEKQRYLRQKQQQGLSLSSEEIEDYEQQEYTLYNNTVAREFMFAQKELGKIHDVVSSYVIKTIELERLPNPDELQSGGGCGCGGGGSCGCGGGGSCGCGGGH